MSPQSPPSGIIFEAVVERFARKKGVETLENCLPQTELVTALEKWTL